MTAKILSDEEKHKQAEESEEEGSESISGTTADLESDDDTLKSAQDVGLYQQQDDEHPGELNIAGEMNLHG